VSPSLEKLGIGKDHVFLKPILDLQKLEDAIRNLASK
jgi:hypothetical protein